jgi:hypothetical protein
MVGERLRKSLLINGVLLVTDIGAGLVLYNYGKSKGSNVSFSIPPKSEFWKMCGVAAITSVLTGYAITKVEDRLDVEIFDPTDQAFLDPDTWEDLFIAFKGWQLGKGDAMERPSSLDRFVTDNDGRIVGIKKIRKPKVAGSGD